MNTGMELMGMKECRECGDPYTVTMDDAGICAGCAGSHEITALKARVAELERERDTKEREIQRLLNVVCDSPACTAAVIRRDDGSRVCAAGHPARWVHVDLLRTTERERDEARADAARLREALKRIAAGRHSTEEFPDKPAHWEVKLVCVRCRAIGADIDHLDARHHHDCPTRIARATLASVKS